jgi:pyrroloquinoline quinone biosynthesis protein B
MMRIGGALAVAALVGCTAVESDRGDPIPSDRPYVLVLGTAQDGGIPHVGCYTGNCAEARKDPARRRLVTSLLLCDPRDGRRWLIDCTPDLDRQLELAQGHPATRRYDAPRPPLFDGLFLTHAHMGHYGGLLQLGREAYAVKEVPTWLTPRFADFLTANGPWRLLVDEQRLVLHRLEEGVPVELAPDLHVVAFRVPHRDEFSDTVGFEIHGPSRSLVYLPDLDKWEKWDGWTPGGPSASDAAPAPHRRVEALLARCDVALLDGCFHADGEIAGRSMKEIPHPFIVESITRFAPLPASERAKVWFTHLNHTNPAADPDGDARRAVRESGMHVLEDGMTFGL